MLYGSGLCEVCLPRLEGFIAEAWGTCQTTEAVDVSQCVVGASGLPPMQPSQASSASWRLSMQIWLVHFHKGRIAGIRGDSSTSLGH